MYTPIRPGWVLCAVRRSTSNGARATHRRPVTKSFRERYVNQSGYILAQVLTPVNTLLFGRNVAPCFANGFRKLEQSVFGDENKTVEVVTGKPALLNKLVHPLARDVQDARNHEERNQRTVFLCKLSVLFHKTESITNGNPFALRQLPHKRELVNGHFEHLKQFTTVLTICKRLSENFTR
jgi:hypothetical protein